jgi:hypothetical protein
MPLHGSHAVERAVDLVVVGPEHLQAESAFAANSDSRSPPEPEFIAFIFPHLSRPRCGPR